MQVSVIIPSYNGVKLLKKHLPNVWVALRSGDEIIIVDDASTDATVAWLQQTYGLEEIEQGSEYTLYSKTIRKKTIRLLVNTINQRFAISCNRGAALAANEILVLLNNDVSPTPNFLTPLLKHFESPKVFGVGCKELATAQHNKEFGRSAMWFERGFYIHKRADDQNGADTAWIAGGSGAFRKTLWEKLKGFDPDYYPAYWEDIDLSFRARTRGWEIRFEPKSVVHHNHESTNSSVFGTSKIETMAYKNQLLFMWKNARGWEFVEHFFWLPYHLVLTTFRSQGAFLIGFFRALMTFF